MFARHRRRRRGRHAPRRGAAAAIAVHGDYDVDGVCSTARARPARCEALGATRARRGCRAATEGYGLSVARVEELHAAGARLLITADCGISAVRRGRAARASSGMDVVVTDHHRPGDELPDCPVVHPVGLRLPGRAVRHRRRLQARPGALRGGRPRPGGARDAARPRRARDGRRPRAAGGREPRAREAGPAGARGHLAAGAARADAGRRRRPAERHGAHARLRARAAHQRGRAPVPRRRGARAAAHRATTDRALEIARELDAINTERQSVETAILFEAERLLSEQGAPDPAARRPALRARRRGLASGRDRHRRLAARGALPPPVRAGRARRRPATAAARAAASGRTTCTPGSPPAPTTWSGFGGHRMAAGLEVEARAPRRASAPRSSAHARTLPRRPRTS